MTTALVSAFSPDFRNLYKGLQSHRATTDFRQHVSLALERQLSGQLANSYASSLITTQVPSFSQNTAKTSAKQHPPLTASNSVANCNVSSHPKTHRKLDRSASEPVERRQTQPPPPPNSSRYKTELCRPFEESGTCKYGDKCQFAHGYSELRSLTRHPKYKTELCRTFHSTGFCPYGPRCHFIHNSEDSKRCLLDTLQSGNSSLSPSSTDYDISGFSIGSAGELSPTSSSGSCSSSLSGFYLDDPRVSSYPQTAPPTMTSGGFFSGDFVPLKSLIPHEDYLQASSSDDDVPSSIEVLVSELELEESSLYETKLERPLYESKLERPLYESKLERPLYESNLEDSIPEAKTESAALDINRNLIRLPIFSRLSLGSSP